MSTPIGKKIRTVREALEMGRAEFAKRINVPKNTLIGIETNEREVRSGVLEAIAKQWPQYAAYLLTNEIYVKQKDPEEESLARELPKAKKAK